MGHEVDGIGGAGGEQDLSRVPSADVVGDFAPGAFVGFGGELGEVMGPAVDVGVVVRQIFPLSFDDGEGLLRAGRIVEVDQWLAMDRPVQDRKVASNAFGQCVGGHL